MSPPFWTPLLPHSSHWGCQRALGLSSMCHIANSHWLSILYMIMYVFQFCSFVFPSPSLIASTSLFYVCVPTAALQMWTIFLNSTYMHSYTIFVFLFLTYFTQYSRLQVRSPHQSWLKCIPFHGWVIFRCIYIYHNFFIHSSVDGRLGCFHVLATVNSAAMNIGVPAPLSVMVSSGYICAIVGLLGHLIVLFLVF